MPSTHQHAGPASEYDDEVTKMVATKDQPTLEALLRGLDDPDDVHEYLTAEIELAEAEGRSPSRGVIAVVNRRLNTLQND